LELTGSQKKRYDEVREELLVRISKTDTEAFIKEIDSILEEYLRAVQIASNPRLVDAEWEGTPVKFKELDDLLAEIVGELGEKAIIWTNYRDNVEELVKRYEAYGARPFSGSVHPDERARTVEIFQDVNSEVKVLVAIPAAGGVGITLTAAQTAIYLDKTWNAEHWMQSIDRIHRIGQKHSVRIISLHACGVDYYIAKNLKRKVDMQAKLLGDNEGQVMSKTEVEHPSREELIAALQD
jgi:SNF2 family DNA or RNA helicase